jgi:GNAT superfamily N-acetyltransferase
MVLSLPRSGRTLRVRDLTPADLPALRRAFLTADPAVLRARFGGAPPKFESLERRVRSLDGHASYAVAAVSPEGDVVGVGEYALNDDGTSAEVAVIVATAWQHEGVATALLARLATHAMGQGITRATALLSGSNSQVLDLVDDIALPHSISYDHGTGELSVDLTADVEAAELPAAREG